LSYRANAFGRPGATFLQQELARPFASLIDGREGEQAEFKASARWDFRLGKMNKDLEDVVARTIAGFLNHRGGTLLVGVGDSGQVTGLEHDFRTLKRGDRDGFEQFVVSLVQTRLGGDVCPHVHVRFEDVEGKDVCRIVAEPSPWPVYCDDEGVARFYLRAGNGTRELDVREALAHVTQRWPELSRRTRGGERKESAI
jgi:predicted HTH transcriptional regulator